MATKQTQESLLSRHRKTTLRFSPHPKPRSMTVRVLHHPTEPAVARCARVVNTYVKTALKHIPLLMANMPQMSVLRLL